VGAHRITRWRMSGRRAHRITRLEDAATARLVRSLARRYALTEEETAELMRATHQELVRWRAGLALTADDAAACDQERSTDDATL
jgi:hypothetical protein